MEGDDYVLDMATDELDCLLKQTTWSDERAAKKALAGADDATAAVMCGPDFDGLLCWPPSRSNSSAVIPCMEELNGVKYDTSDLVSRHCHPNGTWDNYSDYSSCKVLQYEPPPDYTFIIYLCGYSLSLIALFISCATFLYFKEIHCLRNKIHFNLFITYILSNFCWILSGSLQATEHDGDTDNFWCFLVICVRYFHLCTFFWMFVEGLYLFVQVIAAFSIDTTRLKLRHYCIIGWGFPLMVVILWASLISNVGGGSLIPAGENGTELVTSAANGTREVLLPASSSSAHSVTSQSKSSLLQSSFTFAADGVDDLSEDLVVPRALALEQQQQPLTASSWLTMQQGELLAMNQSSCPFMKQHEIESIYIVPIFAVLALNTFFLLWIMWVVITKLRSPTNTAEEHDHQNWKAAKALLVIIPLLGITYLITIIGPSSDNFLAYLLFEHIRAFLLSIQGFAVTLPYCFLNTEIRNVVKCHWERFQTTRSMEHTNQTRLSNAGGRNSLPMCHSYPDERASGGVRKSFHFGRPGHGKRNRFVHQRSLPATYNYTTESTFVDSVAEAPNGDGPATSAGGGGDGKTKQQQQQLFNTIEEASEEFKSETSGAAAHQSTSPHKPRTREAAAVGGDGRGSKNGDLAEAALLDNEGRDNIV